MRDVPELNPGMTFEQMEVGQRFRTSDRTVTETDLVTFVNLFGFNEPLFYDATNAGAVGVGYTGRLVPGAFTYCMAEGLTFQTRCVHGTGMAFLKMELDVRKPVFVGNTIYAVIETTGVRPTSSPGKGIVSSTITVYNEHSEEVLVYTPVRMIKGAQRA